MAAQIAQNYLELHKIGPLFENLMASLIKDMPNEPTTYLIRMLQKADQKLRSPRGTTGHDRSKSASTSMLHSKYGIGVSGHAAPKRSMEEPHMALPGGGKSSKEAWSSTNLSASHGRPVSADQKKRGYQKPWLAGARSAPKTGTHVETKKAERPASSKKKSEWNPDTKTKAKDFDEHLQSQHAPTKSPLSPSDAEDKKFIQYEGVKTWAVGEENIPPQIMMQKVQKSGLIQAPNDEIDIRDIENKKTFEPMEVESSSKVGGGKKLKPYSKAAQKRMKLKALLHEDEKPSNQISEDDDESADEAVEVLEYADDLKDEGVEKAETTGSKLKGHRQRDDGSNFQIKICARCAKVMTTTPYQGGGGFSDVDSELTARHRTALSDIPASEEDFDSVSQIADPSSQKWPVIQPDDDPKGTSSQVFRSAKSSTGNTEFFEANAPRRGQPSQEQVQDIGSRSEMESEVGASDIGGANAWAVRPAESSTDLQ